MERIIDLPEVEVSHLLFFSPRPLNQREYSLDLLLAVEVCCREFLSKWDWAEELLLTHGVGGLSAETSLERFKCSFY